MKNKLYVIGLILLLGGIAIIGYGFLVYTGSFERKAEAAEWSEEKRDEMNALVAENMQGVAIKQTIYFKNGAEKGEAGIVNKKENTLPCTVALVRDSTGEVLYESGLIDPGFYIERIRLKTRLAEGWYPCTVIWKFYDGTTEELLGEGAGYAVVVVKE